MYDKCRSCEGHGNEGKSKGGSEEVQDDERGLFKAKGKDKSCMNHYFGPAKGKQDKHSVTILSPY